MNTLTTRRRETTLAAAAYAALTIVMTWPIGRGIAHDVPADLGDSLLNMWIMAWVSDGALAVARGQMSFADLWNANIFHPTPLALTLSEHLVPQAIQGLPAYLATGNIVLAYNLVFLATFVLSGLGMFLFVRELTSSARAAFVAGLFYAFVPYRLGLFPHIQTLSSQWMPFALFGVRRYFDSGRRRWLAAGTAAFVVQGLSSGYFLFYFAPVLAGYVLWEMAMRGRILHWPTWAATLSAGAASVACTLPFLLPYARAQAASGYRRPYGEVLGFSADLFAYVNAPPQLHFWGPILKHFPQAEGDLFPGAVPLVFAAAAIGLWGHHVWAFTRSAPSASSPRRRALVRVLMAAALLAAASAVLVAVTGGFMWDVAGVPVRMTNVRRTLAYGALCAVLALVLSPRLRAGLRARAAGLTPFLLAATVFAVVMSLGPEPRAGTKRIIGMGLYASFYDLVPGFDGLRAPARFGMVAIAMLAPLAGHALAAVAQWRRFGALTLSIAALAFLGESYAVPLPENVAWASSTRYAAPWPSVHRLNEGPLAYRHVLLMPADTVLLELPFGDPAWDLRYVYYAGLHGKRIVNGYSGYFPDGYRSRAARLAGLWSDGDDAWAALTSSGSTHVLVHEGAYVNPEGPAVSAWTRVHGARLVAEFSDGDKLFELPPR